MCLAPQMPAPPAAPPPPPGPPIPVVPSEPTTVRTAVSTRQQAKRARKGPSSLMIPLSTGGASTPTPNLSIGK